MMTLPVSVSVAMFMARPPSGRKPACISIEGIASPTYMRGESGTEPTQRSLSEQVKQRADTRMFEPSGQCTLCRSACRLWWHLDGLRGGEISHGCRRVTRFLCGRQKSLRFSFFFCHKLK